MFNKFETIVDNTILKHNMINNGDSIVIGVSGGADSVSLLIYLNSLKSDMNLKLTAIHINHGLRGSEAVRDENFVVKLCEELNVECLVYRLDISSIAKSNKISEELAGRNERYRIFNEVVKSTGADKIAVAHNKNDSAETILIKLVRGCSLNGLRGIAPVNENVIRPLINVSRNEIEAYLSRKNFSYVNDSTNKENIYTRNIIRNCVIPYLEKINPGFINTICSNSYNIACDDDFIESVAKKYYNDCILKKDNEITVDFTKQPDIHLALKKRLLIYAYSVINKSKNDLEQKHLEILINAAGTGKKFELGNNITVELQYGKYVFRKNTEIQPEFFEIEITDFNSSYQLNHMRINFQLIDNTYERDKSSVYLNYDKLKEKRIIVRNRRNGDRFIPSGMKGFKKIKDYFIDIKLEKTKRDKIPILCSDNEIASVLGYRVDDRYTVNKDTKEILKITLFGGFNEK